MKITYPFKGMSMNHAYPSSRTGRRFLSPEGKTYKEMLLWHTRSVFKGVPTEKKVYVSLLFHFKDNRRRDAYNYGKVLIDSLTGLLWKDDDKMATVIDKCQPCYDGDDRIDLFFTEDKEEFEKSGLFQ